MNRWITRLVRLAAALFLPVMALAVEPTIKVEETADAVHIETDAISATVVKAGYVSGVAAGSFIDKKTGAKDLGFGLHIWDFLMAPGWRDDGYERDPKIHGNLPKHYVEGPQICTQAKRLPVEIIRGKGYVAPRLKYTFNQPGAGYEAGSQWEQTLLFQPGVRYTLSSDRVVCANTVDGLFYRIDMPGHVKRENFDRFEQVYLSYFDEPIVKSAFSEDFGPDAKFLYQRHDDAVPNRMIRAYQVKVNDRPGPWLAGMTLDPAAVSEAWCHSRGYISFIEELHRKPVKKGEAIGNAYAVGWFDDVAQMQETYDRLRGAHGIKLEADRFELTK